MVNITMSIPEEMKKQMEKFPEINWSAIARAAIKKRLILLSELDNLLKDSELTEEDALRLGRELTKAVAKKYRKWILL